VAARVVLYGIGLALALLAFWLLSGRKQQDREDHVAYLWSRLETLPVVLQADPDGPEALKVLDAEYADPSLPAALRARAERMRGVIARNRKDRAGVDAAYGRAREIDSAARQLSDLEWAQCLVDLGDAVAARQRLPATPRLNGWTETIWTLLVRAQADALGGGPEIARGALGAALDGLPKPLPAEAPMWFGLDAWQPSGAALEATRWLLLDTSGGPEAARVAWQRLGLLAGGDIEALLACADGLLAAGDESAARSALDRARAVDPETTTRALRTRPGLGALGAK
jgi:hypothetical protein